VDVRFAGTFVNTNTLDAGLYRSDERRQGTRIIYTIIFFWTNRIGRSKPQQFTETDGAKLYSYSGINSVHLADSIELKKNIVGNM